MGSSPALDQNFFVQFFFSALWDFFSQISPKGPPVLFLSILQKKWMFKDSQSAPFYMFRHYATYRKPKKFEKNLKSSDFFPIFPQAGTVEENTWHFEVLLLFLSLRYGADLGRSRLVILNAISKRFFQSFFEMLFDPVTLFRFRNNFDRKILPNISNLAI